MRNAATATPATVARVIFPLYGGNVLGSPGVWFLAWASVLSLDAAVARLLRVNRVPFRVGDAR